MQPKIWNKRSGFSVQVPIPHRWGLKKIKNGKEIIQCCKESGRSAFCRMGSRSRIFSFMKICKISFLCLFYKSGIEFAGGSVNVRRNGCDQVRCCIAVWNPQRLVKRYVEDLRISLITESSADRKKSSLKSTCLGKNLADMIKVLVVEALKCGYDGINVIKIIFIRKINQNGPGDDQWSCSELKAFLEQRPEKLINCPTGIEIAEICDEAQKILKEVSIIHVLDAVERWQ